MRLKRSALVGYGDAGRRNGKALTARRVPVVVVDQNREIVEELRQREISAVWGDASAPAVLIQAHIARARSEHGAECAGSVDRQRPPVAELGADNLQGGFTFNKPRVCRTLVEVTDRLLQRAASARHRANNLDLR